MVEIIIKQTTSEDWEVYKQIRLDALQKDSEAFGSSYEISKDYGEDKWRSRAGGKYSLLAFEGDQTVGMMSALPQEDNVALLVGVYVPSEFRGKGISRKLFETIEARLRDDGFRTIELEVNIQKVNAVNAYQNFGFEVVDEVASTMGDGTEAVEYKMVKNI